MQRAKNLNETTGAYYQAFLSGAITIGRFGNIFLTMIIKVQYLIHINFVLMLIGNYVLFSDFIFIFQTWFGTIKMMGAYIGIILIGLGFSSLHPFLISFIEERISMSNKLVAFMTFSSGVFQTIIPFLIGDQIETNPAFFIFLNLVITSVAFVLYAILTYFERIRFRNLNFSTRLNKF